MARHAQVVFFLAVIVQPGHQIRFITDIWIGSWQAIGGEIEGKIVIVTETKKKTLKTSQTKSRMKTHERLADMVGEDTILFYPCCKIRTKR